MGQFKELVEYAEQNPELCEILKKVLKLMKVSCGKCRFAALVCTHSTACKFHHYVPVIVITL